jgi:hypothetical protein
MRDIKGDEERKSTALESMGRRRKEMRSMSWIVSLSQVLKKYTGTG